jgi:hypothetical protein
LNLKVRDAIPDFSSATHGYRSENLALSILYQPLVVSPRMQRWFKSGGLKPPHLLGKSQGETNLPFIFQSLENGTRFAF